MYETVKVVNGYEIKRLIGSRGFYHVNVWEDGEGWGEFHTFHTISIRFEVKFGPQLYSLLVLGSQVSSSSSNDKIEPCTFFGDTFNSVLFMMKRKCEL